MCGATSPETTPYFYRTSNGAEVDLVLVGGGHPHTAIEIKRSPASAASRGFRTTCDEINITNRFVVSATEDRFPVKNGVEAIRSAKSNFKLRAPVRPSGQGLPGAASPRAALRPLAS